TGGGAWPRGRGPSRPPPRGGGGEGGAETPTGAAPRARRRAGRRAARPGGGDEERAAEDPEVARIRAALLAGLPADRAEWTTEQQAKALLADLLDWHRREAKPAWWRYFHLRTLSAA